MRNETWRVLRPFLFLGLIGALTGAAKGLKLGFLGEAGAWRWTAIIPLQLKAQYDLLKGLAKVLENGAGLLAFGGLVLLLLLVAWVNLLKTLGLRLDFKAFREARFGRNLLRLFFLLSIPALLVTHLSGVLPQGDDLAVLRPGYILAYMITWILTAGWVRLAEQRVRPYLKQAFITFLLGILGAGISLLLLVAFQVASENLYVIQLGGDWYIAGFGELGGLCLALAGLYFFLFLMGSVLTALLFRSPAPPRERASLALLLGGTAVVFILVAGWVYLHATSRGYGKDVLELADIPHEGKVEKGHLWGGITAYIGATGPAKDKPQGPRRAVLFRPFGDEGAPVVAEVYGGEAARLSFWSVAGCLPYVKTSTFETTPEHLEKLQRFIDKESTKRQVRYLDRAEIGRRISSGYEALWAPDAGLEALHRGVIEDRHALSAFLEISRLSYAPITPQTQRLIQELSDERKYHIALGFMTSLTKALVHFGDLDRASHFKEKVLRESHDKWIRESIQKVAIPDRLPLTKGVIRGSVRLSGKPLTRGKVGLFTYTEFSYNLFSGRNLTVAQELGADGTFEFQNLGEGKYLVALLTDSLTLPKSHVAVAGNSGLLRLDNEHSLISLTPIELSFNLPPYDETKVRYHLVDFALSREGLGEQSLERIISEAEGFFYERKEDHNVLEALRRIREGVRVENAEEFERKDLGSMLNWKRSGEKVSGRDVKLSTDEN